MGKGNGLSAIPVVTLKGVGPVMSRELVERGIESVWDLFRLMPLRYEERQVASSVSAVGNQGKAVVSGRVVRWRMVPHKWGRRKLFEAVIVDDDGQELSLKWFRWNAGIVKNISREGVRFTVAGKVTLFSGVVQMIHPDVVSADEDGDCMALSGPIPVYPRMGRLKPGLFRRLLKEALDRYGTAVESLIPDKTAQEYGLRDLGTSVLSIHCPGEYGGIESALDGRSRLVMEEFFLFQASLLLRRADARGEPGIEFKKDGPYRVQFIASLPFELTMAQKRSVEEIERDMKSPLPMNRLLQGDVGSGKTVCAVLAACRALDNGFQVAFLAPTEVLAEQHFFSIHHFFQRIGCKVGFLRGGLKRGERKALLEWLGSGEMSLVVGTHALLRDDVRFARLGLVIIDEQQRFGVIQRGVLTTRGVHEMRAPDMLIMSATPIPRTLSMVLHGDLDVSTIDELPRGRKPVITDVFGEKDHDAVYSEVRKELEHGRQAFCVYPLVDESDKSDLPAAIRMVRELSSGPFSDFRVDILHGRMKPEAKEDIMRRFKEHRIDALVCTTVIEVGIDIPNATMIVIENAERFGLSQLHQLRGRVGRGEHRGRCILVTGKEAGNIAKKRLTVLTRTSDGFKVAEKDLALRGPGEVLGERQAGVPDFFVGDLVRDAEIMAEARKVAVAALEIMSPTDRVVLREVVDKHWGGDPGFCNVG